jgi:hypothetical protein
MSRGIGVPGGEGLDRAAYEEGTRHRGSLEVHAWTAQVVKRHRETLEARAWTNL